MYLNSYLYGFLILFIPYLVKTSRSSYPSEANIACFLRLNVARNRRKNKQ